MHTWTFNLSVLPYAYRSSWDFSRGSGSFYGACHGCKGLCGSWRVRRITRGKVGFQPFRGKEGEQRRHSLARKGKKRSHAYEKELTRVGCRRSCAGACTRRRCTLKFASHLLQIGSLVYWLLLAPHVRPPGRTRTRIARPAFDFTCGSGWLRTS
jgi:hypothetical protein